MSGIPIEMSPNHIGARSDTEKAMDETQQTLYGTVIGRESNRQSTDCGRTTASLEIRVSDWMSFLEDDTEVSALSIPGTHDSAAFTYKWPYISTQHMDILKQLNAGIRYFDLRCGIRSDVLEMVHGNAYLGLRLDDILHTLYAWLHAHPREALIVQMKQDHHPEGSTMTFSQAVVNTIAINPNRWRLASTTPCLGELRGQIQLFRRFSGEDLHAYGINVSRWQDNPCIPFTIYTWHGIQITVQDHYAFSDPEPLPSLIAKKGGDVSELLIRAITDKDLAHWYINYSSSFEFNIRHQFSPKEVAVGSWWALRWIDGVNVHTRDYLLRHKGKRRYGIIAMDFPETPTDELVAVIVKSNFEPTEPVRHTLIFAMPVLLLTLFLAACIWTRLQPTPL